MGNINIRTKQTILIKKCKTAYEVFKYDNFRFETYMELNAGKPRCNEKHLYALMKVSENNYLGCIEKTSKELDWTVEKIRELLEY